MFLTRTLWNASKQASGGKLIHPKVAVFDLDHTVWPFGIDGYQFIPPYYQHEGKVFDQHRQEIRHYPDIPKIFSHLHQNGVQIAAASRTKFPSGAYRVLSLFGFDQLIHYFEIYPGQKFKHFERIQQQSKADYSEMIFFDDEERNVIDIRKLGVFVTFVDRELGVTEKLFHDSLHQYSQSRLAKE